MEHCKETLEKTRVLKYFIIDVRGSVYHSTILTENPNKMQQSIKFYYSIFK